MRFSFSLTTRRCWRPATTRSIAASNSSWPIAVRLRRPAKIAASVQMLARAAPPRPGGWGGGVGAGQAGGVAGDGLQVDTGSERHPARVHLEDALAAGEVGRGDEKLAV